MNWTKSSYSKANGNCVEWRVARTSNGTNCVEVGQACASSYSTANGACVPVARCRCRSVHVRDSKAPLIELAFTPAIWARFTASLKTLPVGALP